MKKSIVGMLSIVMSLGITGCIGGDDPIVGEYTCDKLGTLSTKSDGTSIWSMGVHQKWKKVGDKYHFYVEGQPEKYTETYTLENNILYKHTNFTGEMKKTRLCEKKH